MQSRFLILVLVITLSSTSAVCADRPRFGVGGEVIYGGSSSHSKASGDTILLMGRQGSGAPYIGDFESGWNGWTPIDATQPTTSHWQVSNYNQAVPTNLAAWCGDITIASCNDSLDVVGGYGNSWHDLMSYRVAVANPSLDASVNVTAILQHDTEPGYDYVRLSMKTEGNFAYTDIQSWDNAGLVNVDVAFTFSPSEFVSGTDVYVIWRVESDGFWSDSDCLWPTAGACQIDDIMITTSQSGETDIVSFTDFQDGSLGDWFEDLPSGVGNFGKLWRGLEDLDPCVTNYSQQVAFIDDGLVVPGTGGTQCISWCYGPSGYTVNINGGLAGPSSAIHSIVNSPVMVWQNTEHTGLEFAFDVYVHQTTDATSPGIFYLWGMRSADTDGSSGPVQNIEEMPFLNRNFLYFGGPEYRRVINDVSDLLNPGSDVVQIQLSVFQDPLRQAYFGNNGTPAPYFDNISVRTYDASGPSMVALEYLLAQDNFPEIDTLDYDDLGSMHVRFDMAANISPASHLRIDPGDSIIVAISPRRAGAITVQENMHYTIDANPLFDPYRTTPTSGIVAGTSIEKEHEFSPDNWYFDLPDTGTLFPGDVLHYYFRSGEDLLGDIQYATMPIDLTGYGNFIDGPLAYDTRFVVHALPTISDDGNGGFKSPKTLFWDDQASSDSEPAWYSSLQQLGYLSSVDFDIYRASLGIVGIGSRTDGPALAPYENMLYTSGTQRGSTIIGNDLQVGTGDDISALMQWLAQGNKDIFLTGDQLVSDLNFGNGAEGIAFAQDVLGIDFVASDLKTLIDNQMSPLVQVVAGNPVIVNIDRWIAYGGCAAINTFDAVTTRAGATRLAEFTDPQGMTGQYPFAAMVENIHNATNRIIFQPYDLRFIAIDPATPQAGTHAGRVQVLGDILAYFDLNSSGLPSAVLPKAEFSTTNYPNPFNPSTEIFYTIKAPGHLTLKIYNLRGELVKTLLDGRVERDSSVRWMGDNSQGGSVSSGVYFYEARMGQEVEIKKMALVK